MDWSCWSSVLNQGHGVLWWRQRGQQCFRFSTPPDLYIDENLHKLHKKIHPVPAFKSWLLLLGNHLKKKKKHHIELWQAIILFQWAILHVTAGNSQMSRKKVMMAEFVLTVCMQHAVSCLTGILNKAKSLLMWVTPVLFFCLISLNFYSYTVWQHIFHAMPLFYFCGCNDCGENMTKHFWPGLIKSTGTLYSNVVLHTFADR